MAPVHPSAILLEGEEVPPALPVCGRYAGQEALIRKSLSLSMQGRMGPVFDDTADCEDGAQVDRELEHATVIGDLLASTDNRLERTGARILDPGGRISHAASLQDRASHRHWRGVLQRAHATRTALPDDARRAFFE